MFSLSNLLKLIFPGLWGVGIVSGGIGFGTSQGDGQGTGWSATQSNTYGPKWQQRLQQYGAGEAAKLYGQGSTPWYGPTTADFSPEQLAAMGGVTGLASDPNTARYVGQGYGTVSQLLSGSPTAMEALGRGGVNATSEYFGQRTPNVYSPLESFANGNATNGYVSGGASTLGQFSNGDVRNREINQGERALSSFLGPNSNAYTSDAVQAAINPVIDSFSRSILPKLRLGYAGNVGNTGQGIAEGLATSDLTRQLTDTASKIGYDSWNQENANRMQAANTMLSQGNQSLSNRLNAANSLTNVGQNQLSNQLQGINMALSDNQNRANLGLQAGTQGENLNLQRLTAGLDRLNAPLDTTMSLYDRLYSVGQTKQDQQQKTLDGLQSQWAAAQNAPWDNLMKFMQFATGNYGSTTQEAGTSYSQQKTAAKSSNANLSGGI